MVAGRTGKHMATVCARGPKDKGSIPDRGILDSKSAEFIPGQGKNGAVGRMPFLHHESPPPS